MIFDVEVSDLMKQLVIERAMLFSDKVTHLRAFEHQWSRTYQIGQRQFKVSCILAEVSYPFGNYFVAMTVGWTTKNCVGAFINQLDYEMIKKPIVVMIESDMAGQRSVVEDWCRFKNINASFARIVGEWVIR